MLCSLLVLLLLGKDAVATETAPYTVSKTFADFELREYPVQLAAETEVDASLEQAGNQAFRVLAGYIFGNNQGAEKIAMTAPVTQSRGTKIAMTAPVVQAPTTDGKFIVRFMMPAGYTLQSLPKPNDPKVRLVEIPSKRMAVVRYSGTWSRRNHDEHLATLKGALATQGITAVGEPTWARYDPPWMPWFMRHNEIMLEVAD